MIWVAGPINAFRLKACGRLQFVKEHGQGQAALPFAFFPHLLPQPGFIRVAQCDDVCLESTKNQAPKID
jgi:hypothetical protein